MDVIIGIINALPIKLRARVDGTYFYTSSLKWKFKNGNPKQNSFTIATWSKPDQAVHKRRIEVDLVRVVNFSLSWIAQW